MLIFLRDHETRAFRSFAKVAHNRYTPARQNGTSKRHVKTARQNGTSKRHVKTARQNGTSKSAATGPK
jgi:hypothetical protein